MPVGGIKEKVLAAFNSGIKKVIIPEKNKKDLEDIPKEVKQEMDFVLVSCLDEVFREVLLVESLAQKACLKNYLEDRELDGAA